MQQQLSESVRFVKDQLHSQLINPIDIDSNGLFAFSDEPLSINPAHLSATVYVLGLSQTMGSGSIVNGITEIKKLAEEAQDSSKFMLGIASRLGHQDYKSIDMYSLQQKGIGLLN